MFFAAAATVLLVTYALLWRQARGPRHPAALPFDILPLGGGWAVLLSLIARPLAASVAIAALAAGLLLVDVVKRATLREPLVFADRAELPEVVRHPRLYLPFAGPVKVVGGALVAVAAAAALLWWERPAPHPSPLVAVPLALLAWFAPTLPPVLPRLAALYRRHGLSGEPVRDMRRFGFLFTLVAQATVARAERPARLARAAPLPAARPGGGPVVLLQVESFFDPRRFPGFPPVALPNWDRLRAAAWHFGRLRVPCWGANTVRTEFAALTGVGREVLGLDRFNPYERFALSPLPSLAASFREAGYRTIFLHPFDKSFYGRSRVLPLQGFDEFRGPEFFPEAKGGAAAEGGPFVSDAALGRALARTLREEGPNTFVFAVSVGNHGPFDLPDGHEPLPGLADLPTARFLSGLQDSDALLGLALDALPPGGTLLAYGDHQPSLPSLPPGDERTDYALLAPHPARPRSEAELDATELAPLLLRAVDSGAGFRQ